MIEEIYERIYERIGGRPWTSIIRDSWNDSPIVWFFAILGIGSLVGHLFWFRKGGGSNDVG